MLKHVLAVDWVRERSLEKKIKKDFSKEKNCLCLIFQVLECIIRKMDDTFSWKYHTIKPTVFYNSRFRTMQLNINPPHCFERKFNWALEQVEWKLTQLTMNKCYRQWIAHYFIRNNYYNNISTDNILTRIMNTVYI